MRPSIKAILFDVGGPLDTCVIMDDMIDDQIMSSFHKHGIDISVDEYADANRWAIEAFAPNPYQAIIWRISKGSHKLVSAVESELLQTVDHRNDARGGFELREGMLELIEKLWNENFLLGLAANQPAGSLEIMEDLGILQYFKYKEVSGLTGLRKPDPRLLLESCKGLGVNPKEAIMVGDRIDNDIVPAKTLGMIAIRLISGRHANQQARSGYERPDADVRDPRELEQVIRQFIAHPPKTSNNNYLE
ncbi:MAG: HAD family hydrolase [SAR202 cluster bacterium]|nr:HAD family hydrolase [SAR202 cluster bacterium]|tara:strand:+ start:18778 stop:19518 length:741 start_codon:yes stop_codon:yes gene_type:complete